MFELGKCKGIKLLHYALVRILIDISKEVGGLNDRDWRSYWDDEASRLPLLLISIRILILILENSLEY